MPHYVCCEVLEELFLAIEAHPLFALGHDVCWACADTPDIPACPLCPWYGAAGAQVDLVAEGVDTVADIYLNNQWVARTENSHRQDPAHELACLAWGTTN